MASVEQIFTKIRQICESCYEGSQHQIKIPRNYKNLSQPSVTHSLAKQIPQVIIKEYLTVLQYLEQYIHEMKECKQQYQHLEGALQKQELEIRKHIGVQQQLRLYSEGVKLQLEECERQKLELLENSKHTIKTMKLKNQMLFEEVTLLKKKVHEQEKLLEKNVKQSHVKTKLKDKSLSHSPQPKDSSLSKIIKTQYIQREKHPFLNVNIRKELKYKNEPDFEKKHKHHKSAYAKEEEGHNSQSRKKPKGEDKHKGEEKQRQKKDKVKSSMQSKQFDLGTYLSKNQLKRSPPKHLQKHSAKQHASKPGQKHHKSSFQQKSEKHQSKPQTQQKLCRDQLRDSVKQDNKSSSKQKSKSKQSKKRLKSKEQVKQKTKEGKKTVQHNRSLFSVSSVEYRSGVKYNS